MQNGEKGVTYDKNKDRKTPTDIRITKVEGPFDDKGKLVDKIILGTSYVFKATATRRPKVVEVPLLKWAIKLDDGKKEIISGVTPLNKLEGDKIIIQLRVNYDFEKAKIYAFYQKPDDGVSVDLSSEQIEIILIAGREQHSQTDGNKMMFPAQAVREVRQNFASSKHAAIIIFKDGFTEMELSIIKKMRETGIKHYTLKRLFQLKN